MQLTQVIGNWEDVKNAAPLQPFDDNVVEFLGALSKKLVMFRGYSDVSTFGFWCRKAALLQEKAKYDDLYMRVGRGIVFHSTPSNVAVNFAFSFAASLLAGNANIVRLPAKEYEQVNIICEAVKELVNGDYKNLTPYISMIKYGSDRTLHDKLSAICDVRIIWGGDNSIENIRKSPLKPQATDITFADRHSIAVIDAKAYLAADNKEIIAQDFYNDTYLTDQNACTSPRFVFWLGDTDDRTKEIFWDYVRRLACEKYKFSPVQAVGKLNAYYSCAAKKDVNLIVSAGNFVYRVKVNKLESDLIRFKYNSGFFFEYDIMNLTEILPICDECCQTLTYFGVDKRSLENFISDNRPKGIDRAVPIGKSMDFTLVWDGYDLIRQLSRKVNIL